jgi:hypothetical protein
MAVRITYRASVSFESDTQPVQTMRREIVAANAPQAARRAITEARRAFAGSRPRSIVTVLEELSRMTLPRVGKR